MTSSRFEPMLPPARVAGNVGTFDPGRITRPDPSLFSYYLILSVLSNIAFPFIFLPLLFKYRTLTYRFDDEGVAMSWGLLFRKEVYLTYRRIQDIHVTRNILHRWLGLAAIAIQTASGTSGAEMTIEGVLEFEALRDYLYSRMRGAKGETTGVSADAGAAPASTRAEEGTGAPADEALNLLHEIRDELRRLNESRRAGP